MCTAGTLPTLEPAAARWCPGLGLPQRVAAERPRRSLPRVRAPTEGVLHLAPRRTEELVGTAEQSG